MQKVLNKHKDIIPKDAVYIGRPSKWGNPFTVGRDGSREEVVEKYCQWLLNDSRLTYERIQTELKGKDLVCFCAPLKCHGDVLLRIANE